MRSPYGGGIFGGQTHSQSPEGLFTHVCGLKTVIPSNPYDAKGLLISAIEDDDPVLFFEPKRLYAGPFDGHYEKPIETWAKHPAGEVPAGYYSIPLGKAAIARAGQRSHRFLFPERLCIEASRVRAEATSPSIFSAHTHPT